MSVRGPTSWADIVFAKNQDLINQEIPWATRGGRLLRHPFVTVPRLIGGTGAIRVLAY